MSSANATAIEHISNGRCFAATAPLEGPPLFVNGDIVFQAHDVGWLVCAIFTLFSCGFSFWLINKHLVNYTNRAEQRYIVRLLFMPPLYALVSTASFILWNHATALLLIRDCYEGVVLVSFFYLLLTYLSPDPVELADIFRTDGLSKEQDARLIAQGKPPGHWWFPLNKVKWRPADGMYFLQFMKWTVLQYIVIRPLCTLASVILNYIGLYCEESWSPAYFHVYSTIIISISVSVAMYCLVQLYLCVAPRLARHQPILKLFSIKAVVFLTFWQATFLSVLAMFNAIKDTPYMTAEDIEVGWGAILETFEMCAFALLHIKAFSYKPYAIKAAEGDPPPKHTSRLRSLAHAFNFGETWREIRDGWTYLLARIRGQETDVAVRRLGHHEKLFARSRPDIVKSYLEEPYESGNEKDRLDDGSALDSRVRSIEVGVHRTVDIDRDGENLSPEGAGHVYHPSGRSWWRGLYDRVSSSHIDEEPLDYPQHGRERSGPRIPNFSWPMRNMHAQRDGLSERERECVSQVQREMGIRTPRSVREYDDVPPPSLIRGYRDQQRSQGRAGPTHQSQFSRSRERKQDSVRRQPSSPPTAVPPITMSPPPAPPAQSYSPPPRELSGQVHSSPFLSRPPVPHMDSATTLGSSLGFHGAFQSGPPSSAGHPSMSAGRSTPSLVPSSSHSGPGRQPIIRQVNAGRVVNVALPTPLASRNEALDPALSAGLSSPSPYVQSQPSQIISPFKRRSQLRESASPSLAPASSPPQRSLDISPPRTSLPSPSSRRQFSGEASRHWVHPELANDRPIYAAAMQAPSSPPRAHPTHTPTYGASSASLGSVADNSSFVTADEGVDIESGKQRSPPTSPRTGWFR